ncbi:MAG: sigma-70 family RNA polymerase sigma factor [Oscillospiraceae bacterium]|nr:sigma-70 family RNA polymerase sigma factor [Oscillospiraceae bacterium]
MAAFETLSDEALAAAAKDSVEAEGVLLSRYLGLIRYHAGRMAGCADADDLVQEGLIALLRAIPQFDGTREVKFSSYAQTCILNRMRSFVQRESRNAVPCDDLVQVMEEQGELADPDTPESILVEKESYAQRRMQVMALLSAREWEILQCVMDGASYAEAAARLGIAEKAVDNAMQRIRRKMRAVRSTDYFDQ